MDLWQTMNHLMGPHWLVKEASLPIHLGHTELMAACPTIEPAISISFYLYKLVSVHSVHMCVGTFAYACMCFSWL